MPRDLSARVPSRLAAVVALVVVGLAAVSVGSTPAHAQGSVYYVNPDTKVGNNANPARPARTVHHSPESPRRGAGGGDDQPRRRHLPRGRHHQARRDRGGPITVKGPQEGRDKAVLYGLGGRVFSIDHSYYTLTGFTIDGQRTSPAPSTRSHLAVADRGLQGLGAGAAVNSKLVYVGASTTSATSSARPSRTCSSTAQAANACGSATAPRTA